jgi:ATP-dependent Clp protease ATP-binding subunit ClpA
MRRTPEFESTLERAREECRLLGHGFVGSEHLLLGLLGYREGAAAKFLRERKFSLSRLRQEVVSQVGKGDGNFSRENPPPSLRALGIVRLAEESARLEGTEADGLTLLWALLRDRESDASQLLSRLEVDLNSWAAAVEERIGERTSRRPRTFFRKGERQRSLQAEMRRWKERMKGARDLLNEQMVGQTSAVDRVVATLTRAWAGLAESRRPLASFLFLGPRGAGKATLARLLAPLLYGDEERLLRIDMEEFGGEGDAERLTGSPTEPLGLLTSLALEYPYSIFLLESIERAHPRALAKVTQILGRGFATDGQGQRVSFRDHVIVLAVNIDSEYMERTNPLGFRLSSRGGKDVDVMERELLPEVERGMGREITEKVDEVILFCPLEEPEFRQLLERWSRELEDKLWQRRSLRVEVSTEITESILAESHTTPDSLRRSFLRCVENRLAAEMLSGRLKAGESYKLEVTNDVFRVVKKGRIPE